MAQAAFDFESYYNSAAQLDPVEIVWRDRQEYLASRGYMLRARCRPGWIASWKLDPSIQKPFFEEDFPLSHVSEETVVFRIVSTDVETGVATQSHGCDEGGGWQAHHDKADSYRFSGVEDRHAPFLS